MKQAGALAPVKFCEILTLGIVLGYNVIVNRCDEG